MRSRATTRLAALSFRRSVSWCTWQWAQWTLVGHHTSAQYAMSVNDDRMKVRMMVVAADVVGVVREAMSAQVEARRV